MTDRLGRVLLHCHTGAFYIKHCCCASVSRRSQYFIRKGQCSRPPTTPVSGHEFCTQHAKMAGVDDD